jgi:1,2-diacylglycerol-3-alpha-glucose alpha-1,2-galactosyltransferase
VGSIIFADRLLPVIRRYMRWYYNRADKVLAVSGVVAEILHVELDVPKEKIETFYNTIDMKQYAFTPEQKAGARKKLGIKKDEFVVLGIGQVQPRKRLDIFVKMAKELPDVTFIWVGGIPFKQLGADYQAMQKLMNSAPKNLKIAGIIPHDQVSEYLAAASIFCLPAEQENHPMCVLEAAGAGLPIILRDIPEYDDTFRQDAIRCKDSEFSAAVRTLQKPAEYKKWQAKASAIAERFDSNAAAERLVELYRQLV